MSSRALEHFLDQALEEHAPALEDAFPRCFDWHGLVRDIPAMAEVATAGGFDTADQVGTRRLEHEAEVVFRTAHVAALAAFCATEEGVDDPAARLEGFAEPPDDDEEVRFGVLVGEVLGPAEEFFADPEIPLDERGVEVHRLFAKAWPYVADYVSRLAFLWAQDGAGEDGAPQRAETHDVLIALARVAVILAAQRWMAAEAEPA